VRPDAMAARVRCCQPRHPVDFCRVLDTSGSNADGRVGPRGSATASSLAPSDRVRSGGSPSGQRVATSGRRRGDRCVAADAGSGRALRLGDESQSRQMVATARTTTSTSRDVIDLP
jgi:hypothetical protein